MEWNAARAVSAVFALAMAAMLAGQAHASCGKSQRINHTQVDCLEADWSNKNFPVKGKASARNLCSEHGKVVVKVDRQFGSDWIWHLTDGDKKKDNGGHKIREISCCSDLSDLCDTSEMHDDSCLERFQASSADETCESASANFTSSSQCEITARCTTVYGHTQAASIAAKFREIKELHNCNGVLQVGECD